MRSIHCFLVTMALAIMLSPLFSAVLLAGDNLKGGPP
jgi:hypothetical protein